MSEKLNSSESYEVIPLHSSKSVPELSSQQLYPYPNMTLNAFSPHIDMYNNFGTHSYRSQIQTNSYSYFDQQSDINWDNRLINDLDKNMKMTDKIDLVEITNKALSPASYCSNIDMLIPDFYKTGAKDTNLSNKYESYWLSNVSHSGQQSLEYPSCAQVSKSESHTAKPIRYCSIQRDVDTSSKQNDTFLESNVPPSKNCAMRTCDFQSQYPPYLPYQTKDDNHNAFESIVEFYNQTQPINEVSYQLANGEQQSEASNEDSDIIVEETDDDVTDDVSEDQERRFYNQTNKCVICNLLYTPSGTQFYFLTAESPLTMSSQKPVFQKVEHMVGSLLLENCYLCNQCLGLINTIDHLQWKLQYFQKELQVKFNKTCRDNNLTNPEICTVHKKVERRGRVKKFPNFKCKICKHVLNFQKILKSHIHKHKKRLLCELCGRVFSSSKRFEVHSQHHKLKKKIKIDPFKCSNCPKYFRTKSNLKEHENYCLGILPHKCKVYGCDKKFASSSKLKNHVKLKHDKKFIAICSICNIGFVTVNHYKSHKISHSTDKKYSCKKCDKSYKTMSNLNFHMKAHDNKLPFMCHICHKGFMRKEYLEAHVNNHKGIKNFTCLLCEKKFVSQKNLDSHLKYHDGSVKKKTCNICGKSMSAGFEEHLRIHSNLLEYECDYCDKKFNTKGTLSKHKKLKHNIKLLSNNAVNGQDA